MHGFMRAQPVCTEKLIPMAAVNRVAAIAIVKADQIFVFYIIGGAGAQPCTHADFPSVLLSSFCFKFALQGRRCAHPAAALFGSVRDYNMFGFIVFSTASGSF